MLATAAVVALAAERISAGPSGPARGIPAIGDLASFAEPATLEAVSASSSIELRVDPFETPATEGANSVASPAGSPTVSGSPARRLTAILVADNRPIAVVDDEVVSVGDVLRDGARVSRIQSDRVFVVEKNGRWRTLTLATGKP